MIRVIQVIIDDLSWPKLRCSVGQDVRESMYDTAATNFEPQVMNAIRFAVTDLIHNKKHPQPEPLTKAGEPQRRGLDDGPPLRSD